MNIDFDSSKFEVHHIDQDRSNNDIENLVLLPKKLHRRYHFFKPDGGAINAAIVPVLYSGNYYYEDSLTKFISCLLECCKWMDYKYYLLGEAPNYHNLSLNDTEEANGKS